MGDLRRAAGEGASTLTEFVGLNLAGPAYDIRRTPVIIIGAGPAGVMAARGLTGLGFSRDYIRIIDKHGQAGGIWTYPNVSGLSRNNPKDLVFLNRKLAKAPGGGDEVYRFTKDLMSDSFGEKIHTNLINGIVTRVEPGDLDTTVYYKTDAGEYSLRAPIVINALGLGSPVPLSDDSRMTTTANARDAGPRWQQVIDNSYDGKRITLVGLGNSTAEMLTQINRLSREGYEIDYRILTHYPRDAVYSPNETVAMNDKTFRVFRDLSVPNLVDFTGDLPEINEAYYRALMEGKIIPDVVHWDIKDGTVRVKKRSGESKEFKSDAIFTLTGYRNKKEVLDAMGLKARDDGAVHYDYDGEFQARPGRAGKERLYRGYFGLGAVLNSPENPNAIVIPGMMHRMGDMLFGVTMRAYETAAERRQFSFAPNLIRAAKNTPKAPAPAPANEQDRGSLIADLLKGASGSSSGRHTDKSLYRYDKELVSQLLRESPDREPKYRTLRKNEHIGTSIKEYVDSYKTGLAKKKKPVGKR